MASNKPPLHGHDHLPGHIDPIPGLADLISGVVGASIIPDHCKYNNLTGVSLTIPSGNGDYVEWHADAGNTALLDVSGVTSAVVTARGVYACAATYTTTSSGWTIGSTYWASFSANGVDLQSQNSSVTVGEHDLPAGGDLFTGYGFIALAPMEMRVGDQFQLQLNNYDDSTHDLNAIIWATRLYSY